ncbi:MAG TPA: hypothetical protein VMW09_07925 [Desulfatiglandales bacterium]|nr:hypothetical protein [Desulfatiglandales bacterium]
MKRTIPYTSWRYKTLRGEVKNKEAGANGMSAEQVVKAAIIKQSHDTEIYQPKAPLW